MTRRALAAGRRSTGHLEHPSFCFEESLLELQGGDGSAMFLHETIHQASLLHLPRGENWRNFIFSSFYFSGSIVGAKLIRTIRPFSFVLISWSLYRDILTMIWWSFNWPSCCAIALARRPSNFVPLSLHVITSRRTLNSKTRFVAGSGMTSMNWRSPCLEVTMWKSRTTTATWIQV